MQTITDFATVLTTLVCPECNSLFAGQTLCPTPPVTMETPIEADFHRLVPDVAFRGALVAYCPACEKARWTVDFGTHMFPPDLVPVAPDMEPSMKFAQAILHGRERKAPALDLALLSLNGLWCARQEDKPTEPWLELTIHELSAALVDRSWKGNRPYYEYLRGEMRRLSGDFIGALESFDATVPQMKVPQELIDRQKSLAKAGNQWPILLPPHLVDQIFCFHPVRVSQEAIAREAASQETSLGS